MQPRFRTFVFKAKEEERLGKQLKSMGITEIQRGRKEDIKLYFEI